MKKPDIRTTRGSRGKRKREPVTIDLSAEEVIVTPMSDVDKADGERSEDISAAQADAARLNSEEIGNDDEPDAQNAKSSFEGPINDETSKASETNTSAVKDLRPLKKWGFFSGMIGVVIGAVFALLIAAAVFWFVIADRLHSGQFSVSSQFDELIASQKKLEERLDGLEAGQLEQAEVGALVDARPEEHNPNSPANDRIADDLEALREQQKQNNLKVDQFTKRIISLEGGAAVLSQNLDAVIDQVAQAYELMATADEDQLTGEGLPADAQVANSQKIEELRSSLMDVSTELITVRAQTDMLRQDLKVIGDQAAFALAETEGLKQRLSGLPAGERAEPQFQEQLAVLDQRIANAETLRSALFASLVGNFLREVEAGTAYSDNLGVVGLLIADIDFTALESSANSGLATGDSLASAYEDLLRSVVGTQPNDDGVFTWIMSGVQTVVRVRQKNPIASDKDSQIISSLRSHKFATARDLIIVPNAVESEDFAKFLKRLDLRIDQQAVLDALRSRKFLSGEAEVPVGEDKT